MANTKNFFVCILGRISFIIQILIGMGLYFLKKYLDDVSLSLIALPTLSAFLLLSTLSKNSVHCKLVSTIWDEVLSSGQGMLSPITCVTWPVLLQNIHFEFYLQDHLFSGSHKYHPVYYT